jgi:mRNA interferase MazF
MTFVKNFTEWFRLKPKLDGQNHQPPLVKERGLWWCHLGENIGTEISGKGVKFNRPVIILKKLSRHTYMVIPTSTKVKQGSWFVYFKYNMIDMVACLHQVKTIDYRRIEQQIGSLSVQDFKKVKQGFSDLYK